MTAALANAAAQPPMAPCSSDGDRGTSPSGPHPTRGAAARVARVDDVAVYRGGALDARGTAIRGDEVAFSIAPLLSMLDACTPEGCVELERALAAALGPAPESAAQRRVTQLQSLTRLLESRHAVLHPHHHIAPVQVPRAVYDAHRGEGAPTSATLTDQFGGARNDGWAWACRAARGLLPDGRKVELGAPHPSVLRGRRRPPRTRREEVLRTIRACAFSIGRRPSSNVFVAWTKRRRRQQRRIRRDADGGRLAHIASIENLYTHFPSWADALEAARITDEELVAARSRWTEGIVELEPPAPPALDVLESLTQARLDAMRLPARRRDELLRGGSKAILNLPFPQACELAVALGGSLAWLAGQAERRGPSASPGAFDGAAFARRRTAAGVRDDAVLRSSRIPAGRYRRIIRGTAQPTLGEALRLERAIRPRVR